MHREIMFFIGKPKARSKMISNATCINIFKDICLPEVSK